MFLPSLLKSANDSQRETKQAKDGTEVQLEFLTVKFQERRALKKIEMIRFTSELSTSRRVLSVQAFHAFYATKLVKDRRRDSNFKIRRRQEPRASICFRS